MPINPLYEPLSEQLMPAQRWLDSRDAVAEENFRNLPQGVLGRAMNNAAWQMVPEQFQMVPSQERAEIPPVEPQQSLVQNYGANRGALAQPDYTLGAEMPSFEQPPESATPYIPTGLSDADIGAVNAARRSQRPEQRILGTSGGESGQSILPDYTKSRGILAQPDYSLDAELPQLPPVEPPQAQPPQQPDQPIVDEQRLAQTTLGRRAAEQGWDPRRLMAAMAEFAGGVGNIRGKPTQSTAMPYVEAMLAGEEQQRQNDMKLEEMARRYAPKPADPMDEIKRELVKYQIEALRNKIQVDSEINDPNSERSAAFRGGWERLMHKQGFDKFKADPNISGADVLKWLTATQMGITQTQVPGRVVYQTEAAAGEAEKGRTFKAEESAKDRELRAKIATEGQAGAMARTQAQQAGAKERLGMKPAAKTAGQDTLPGQPRVEVPGWKRVQNVPTEKGELVAFRKRSASVPRVIKKIKSLQNFIKIHGPYQNKDLSAAGARMDALANDIKLDLKGPEFKALGVLTGPDMKILEALVPDTNNERNAFRSAEAANAALSDLIVSLQEDLTSAGRSIGFEPDTSKTAKGTEEIGSTGLKVWQGQ